ncbi:uncharacterized protein EI90DRAFT_3072726 [Cantharellus anzutake]|uniref:uncharacterized protein n=1 Tax=Cantharellus anzutake TaxID=1750568 RepID=UPI001904F976|nr:uncharacterized protein EI90DRAFT_3072726 [Cantharellus anzutake]KAF8325399.1 hypothetical protein EI90DRAFT_3072726 [Cantharellus anzutake]
MPSNPRVNKHKEKFYELRTKYENVSNINTQRQQELAASNAKLRKLQDECGVILDTMAFKAASEPTLAPYLQRGRTPPSELPPTAHPLPPGTSSYPTYHTTHEDHTAPLRSDPQTYPLSAQIAALPFSPHYPTGADSHPSMLASTDEIDPRDLVEHSFYPNQVIPEYGNIKSPE